MSEPDERTLKIGRGWKDEGMGDSNKQCYEGV